MNTQNAIREAITSKIADALQRGVAPWRRPWSDLENTGSPASVGGNRPYGGINNLILQLVAGERGYSSRWWSTFRCWTGLGFRVKARPKDVAPGEWGTRVVYCKAVSRKPDQDRAHADECHEFEDQREDRPFLVLREYTVFNAEQVEGDGIEKHLARPRTSTAFVDYEPAERLIAATDARIEYGGNRAVYFPDEDFIRLPHKHSFESQHEFYATAFHELVHHSGHPTRLERLHRNARFGSEAYAFEELVAEIGGCFLCNEVGIPQSSKLDNHAAYVASWLAVLERDTSVILTAASQASKAVDYILSSSRAGQGAEGDKAATPG